MSQYDEAIRFVSESGAPLGGVSYKLHLANGDTVQGQTGSDGTTSRVQTASPESIVTAVLVSPEGASCCASLAGMPLEEAVFELDAVATNNANIGGSLVQVETKGHERGLTAGEIHMARLVFGDAVDYTKVKVHNHGYWLFFGFQDKNTAVTPNGEMYFPKDLFKEDFSVEQLYTQHWFMHEMAHVWQYQRGYPVKMVRAPRPNMSYEYVPSPGKKLHDYNMEAQGDILADYFLAKYRGSASMTRAAGHVAVSEVLPALELLLEDFLKNPSSESNLPNTAR